MKKVFLIALSALLSACGSDYRTQLDASSVDYSNRDSYGYKIYESIIDNKIRENFSKAEIMSYEN